MIIYCNSITQKENVGTIICLVVLGMVAMYVVFTRWSELPFVMMLMYPLMILFYLKVFNYCYQLKKTVYSLEFEKNQCIITTYWGNKVLYANELIFSISNLTMFQAKIWDMLKVFHYEREIITIRDGEKSYYICNKNDADKKIHTFLKENSYLN
ncbi:hypothetical protein ACOMICROBIO_NCLOACGD_05493 [Vibrio sp. B1ASS3]|uniref:hypothetical protein n=1 Tax=Vibrio sp. B1ASS3 TaxID=2751176 RepID=UPI001ABB4E36|nr:hypothetical protein [Vibrio sp. B1ASS3]CAD7827835.1 hypothetical protein ACOMICROBIO_NCLOACGD_05493 [Vibrio sp. B1ASS3]CAE6966287.1 hypothetical protein ACOMICROBIO_NCLOACGD_05493 [Vibrio sp. B1ASS3]